MLPSMTGIADVGSKTAMGLSGPRYLDATLEMDKCRHTLDAQGWKAIVWVVKKSLAGRY